MKKQGDNHEIFYCEGHNYGFENFIRLVILSLLNNSVLTLTMVLPNKTACTVCNQSILFTWNGENKNQKLPHLSDHSILPYFPSPLNGEQYTIYKILSSDIPLYKRGIEGDLEISPSPSLPPLVFPLYKRGIEGDLEISPSPS
ncbi:MAG TPA: hypothetical protein PLQ41_06280, partial [bacterium]|nr:hypothetical protein [bacterium]